MHLFPSFHSDTPAYQRTDTSRVSVLYIEHVGMHTLHRHAIVNSTGLAQSCTLCISSRPLLIFASGAYQRVLIGGRNHGNSAKEVLFDSVDRQTCAEKETNHLFQRSGYQTLHLQDIWAASGCQTAQVRLLVLPTARASFGGGHGFSSGHGEGSEQD